MALMARTDRNWYRARVWDDDIAARFEERLARSRTTQRPKYLRIQATYLAESSDARTRAVAFDLFRRAIHDYRTTEATAAAEQLGDSLARDGRLAEGADALRTALSLIAESPIGRAGTTHLTELRLAEVLLELGDVDEAAAQLDAAAPEVELQKIYPDVHYRYLVAHARVEAARGRRATAAMWARAALAVADDAVPHAPLEPALPRPAVTATDRADLERLAARG